MTPSELDELLADCPMLYHVTDCGNWPSIRRHGLLSTAALLDRYGVAGPERVRLESQRRIAPVTLKHPDFPDAVIRDQLPLGDAALKRCLPSYLSPSDWYRLLNGKVFFWLTPARVGRLITAKSYRSRTHEVIELPTRALVESYYGQITLSPINTGFTRYIPQPRDENTFQRIGDYPYALWKKRRKAGERAVELTVNYAVPDIGQLVTRVTEQNSEGDGRLLHVGANSTHGFLQA